MWTLDLTILLTIGLLFFVGLRSHWTSRLLVLLLLSPVLRYVSTLFGFSIRLTLSAWAGTLLRLADFDVVVLGNELIYNGFNMAVDPACMGLQLTGTSLLVAIGWLVWAERQAQKRLPVVGVIGYGIVAFGLTMGCNLFRIMLLVLFHVAPNDPLHEITGLLCVAVYVWLPLVWLSRTLVGRYGRPDELVAEQRFRLSGGIGLLLLSLGMAVSWLTGRPVRASATLVPKAGYQAKLVANGYVQYSRPGVLIYEKPLPDWWSAEHSPTACWVGSGYTLRRIRETLLGGHLAYVATLHRNGQTLYTAWWFSNGHYQTIRQLDFRWRMAQQTGQANAPVFRLVNITALSWAELRKRSAEWEGGG